MFRRIEMGKLCNGKLITVFLIFWNILEAVEIEISILINNNHDRNGIF